MIEKINIPKDKVIIITGENNSGKTRTLKFIRDGYLSQNKNVLYFETNRKLLISKEEVDSICVMQKLINTRDLLEQIEMVFNISDPFILNEIKVGDYIHCGYMQIVNLLFTIEKNYRENKKEIILLIDNFELNLHPLVRKHLLRIFTRDPRINKVIITTYDWDSELWGFKNNIYYIKNIIEGEN